MTPADYDRLLTVIRALLDRLARVIAAIDGRCGAGKSTLAAQLQAQLSCRVFHMDDFFLRPEQRTAARLVVVEIYPREGTETIRAPPQQ